jgi:hypothetical protein
MVNQQFRRDYWVKGARTLNAQETAEALGALKVILVQPKTDVSLKFTGTLGEVTMQSAVYDPILDALADHKPKTLAQIEEAVKGHDVLFAQVVQAAMILTGSGSLAAVQDETVIARARKHTDKLNAHLIDKTRTSSELSYLASPVTGGGITVGRFHQLFLLALKSGKKQPSDWAQTAWQLLSVQGQRLLKDGKALETPEENIEELTTQATVFKAKHLPILKALQIA